MAKKLWGGRFSKGIDPLADLFTRSIQYDHKLAEYDLIGSVAHVAVLKKAGYLTAGEAAKLQKALKSVYNTVKNGTFKFDPESEDIHTDIQNKLTKKAGSLVLKLHTARSRNDQVAFAAKLYSKDMLWELQEDVAGLASALRDLADKNKDVIMPGFTHMQHAQPIYLKDYLGAYVEMLKRDSDRLVGASTNIKLTMGAGALAGTPIDVSAYSVDLKELLKCASHIEKTVNSLDSVSDRDFVIEIISALSIAAMHLSRLAEDLIIWATKEFDFVEIDESFCTGSSLMPQKKNADVLEMIRGYAGRLYGNLVSVLTMMKGLPLTYNRDMQLDKEPLFNSFETLWVELELMKRIIGTLRFNKEKIARHLEDESLYATDLVYYLVDLDIPFKTAHTLIGELITYSIDNTLEIKDMPEGLLKKKLSPKVTKKEIVKRLDPVFSVKSKRSIKR
ncbi:MAG: argininosuccinate lyase [Candidatus Omnitrophota bacterium]|jgi:argininosuccinate lyase